MNKFKRILTLVLSLAMIASSTVAFAAPPVGSGEITVYVTDEVTGAPVDGASILIEDITAGSPIVKGTITTSGGVATYSVSNSGYFRLTLSYVPEDYCLDIAPKTLFVDVTTTPANAAQEYFKLTPKGQIEILCLDAETGAPIAGAAFSVKNSLGVLAASGTTDASGKLTAPKIDAGAYTVYMDSIPVPYIYANATRDVYVYRGKTSQVKFENLTKPYIAVSSYLLGTTEFVPGVTYELKADDGSILKSETLNSQGEPIFKDLVPAVYTLTVKTAPDGYEAMTSAKVIDLRTYRADSVRFDFKKLSAIQVMCVDAEGNPLEGTVFQIRDDTGKALGTYMTDAAGTFVTETFTPGKYLIQEMIATEGYIPDSYTRTVIVRSNELTKELFTNNQKSCIVIYSYDSYGEVVPGTSYKIIHTQTGVEIDQVTVDASGFGISKQLDPGLYVVEEVNVPTPYVIEKVAYYYVYVGLNQASAIRFIHTPKSVIKMQTVDTSGNPVNGAKYMVTSVKYDYTAEFLADIGGEVTTEVLMPGIYEVKMIVAPSGYLRNELTKTLTVTSDKVELARFIVEAESGLSLVNVDTAYNAVPGATFKITTESGTLVGTYKADKYGKLYVKLDPGSYKLTQATVPAGWLPSSEVVSFTITGDKSTTVEYVNPIESGIRVKVIDEETNDPIYGVSIIIRDGKDKIVGTYKTDNKGMIVLDGELKPGKYSLEMTAVPDGYMIDKVNKSFTVIEGDVVSVIWKISGIKGQIRILTYSGEDSYMVNVRKNVLLSGVTYEIQDSTGKVVRTISDKDGYCYSGSLPIGTYYIVQTKAPRGFGVNSGRVTVNVTAANRDINVTVYDPAVDYQSTLDIKGPAAMVAGRSGKFYVASIEGPKTAVRNFYMNFKIPTDALRMGTFYTGTYNQYATYRIEYKTNMMGSYKVLAKNLSSMSTYSYDLSTRALGLSAGEWVTDVRLVFDNIEKGFKSSTAPSFYAYALSTVQNGYQYTVRAEIGSLANGDYYNNASLFTGIIMNNGSANINGSYYNYFYTPGGLNYYPIPGQLLKTGY